MGAVALFLAIGGWSCGTFLVGWCEGRFRRSLEWGVYSGMLWLIGLEWFGFTPGPQMRDKGQEARYKGQGEAPSSAIVITNAAGRLINHGHRGS